MKTFCIQRYSNKSQTFVLVEVQGEREWNTLKATKAAAKLLSPMPMREGYFQIVQVVEVP